MIVIRTKYGSLTRRYRLLTRLASLTATLRIFCFPPPPPTYWMQLPGLVEQVIKASSVPICEVRGQIFGFIVPNYPVGCRSGPLITVYEGYKFVTKILKDLKVLHCLEKLLVRHPLCRNLDMDLFSVFVKEIVWKGYDNI